MLNNIYLSFSSILFYDLINHVAGRSWGKKLLGNLWYSNAGELPADNNASASSTVPESHGQSDAVPAPSIAVPKLVPPPRRSLRSKRKPLRFADEYDKYY